MVVKVMVEATIDDDVVKQSGLKKRDIAEMVASMVGCDGSIPFESLACYYHGEEI